MSGRTIAGVVALLTMLTVGAALAAPPATVSCRRTSTRRTRAGPWRAAHARALDDLNAGIYHCWPWVEVQKASIGFYRPKNVQQDDRYLSVRIYIEQDPSPAFAKLRFEERAAAMFSRYVGPLLRRMTKDPAVAADATLDGFTVILEWMKPAPPAVGGPSTRRSRSSSTRRLRSTTSRARSDVKALSGRARVLGFDGETALGAITIGPTWDDNFVSTFKVSNYQIEPGATCP